MALVKKMKTGKKKGIKLGWQSICILDRRAADCVVGRGKINTPYLVFNKAEGNEFDDLQLIRPSLKLVEGKRPYWKGR